MADQGTGQQRPAGWKKDPSGRHYGRYWDGQTWTENVISAEKVQSIDSLPPRPEASIFDDAAPPDPPRQAAPPAPATPRTVAMPTPPTQGPSATAPGWIPNGRGKKSGGVWAAVRAWPRWAKWTAGIAVLVLLIAAGSGGSDDDKETVSAGQGKPATTAASAAASEPATSKAAAPAATQPADPQARLQAAIGKALGSGRKGVPRVSDVTVADEISVSWAIGESLTDGLTKDKARKEGVQILEAVKKEGLNYSALTLVGSYELVDRFGTSSESVVVRATYSKATVDRINFSGFDFKNAFTIASPAVIHPTFQY